MTHDWNRELTVVEFFAQESNTTFSLAAAEAQERDKSSVSKAESVLRLIIVRQMLHH